MVLLHGIKYPGSIETDLPNRAFLLKVLLSVGFGLEDAEAEMVYLEKNGLLTELYLSADGFCFDGTADLITTEYINLVLRSNGVWLVDDYSLEQLSLFVSKLQ